MSDFTRDWPDLAAELDAWGERGQRATLWWRDDDAVEPTPALDRLIGVSRAQGVPLMLAVVPARAGQPLVDRLAGAQADCLPVQHGFAHVSHAPAGERKWELGAHRPLAAVLEELARGRARMDALFGFTWLPVLVPPWNRIAPEVVSQLGTLGYIGLSAATPRPAPFAAPGVFQVNAHVDIMRWGVPRGFLGTGQALKRLVGYLRARRAGEADPAEPTGLLTHHLAHDEDAWVFLDQLLTTLNRHPAVTFVHPRAAFTSSDAHSETTQRGAA
jgi:hypothetical protein